MKQIPLAVPNLAGNEARYLSECIATNFVSTAGPFVVQFEDLLRRTLDFPFGHSTNSGTSALHVALMALGTRPKDLVIMPSYTFAATASAVRTCGAEPWFVDIDESSWTMSAQVLRDALLQDAVVRSGVAYHRKTKQRIAAVLPVFAMGHPADMDQIHEIADDFCLPVLADAAAAIGCQYKSQALGRFCRLATFSFNGNKTLTSGGGGAVMGKDDSTVSWSRHLATTARTSEAYTHDAVGFNYRITNIQAAVGLAQLERIEQLVGAKLETDRRYRETLESGPLHPFPKAQWAMSSCWMTGFLIPRHSRLTADSVMDILKRRGIEARGGWRPLHLQQPYRHHLKTVMSITDDVWSRVICLPSSTGISSAEIEHVSSSIKMLSEIA